MIIGNLKSHLLTADNLQAAADAAEEEVFTASRGLLTVVDWEIGDLLTLVPHLPPQKAIALRAAVRQLDQAVDLRRGQLDFEEFQRHQAWRRG